MKNNFLYLTLLFALIFAAGCRKDEIVTETEILPVTPVVYDIVDSEIYGTVSDREGNAVENAAVRWGDTETLTDENGFFLLTGAVRERNAVLTVTRPGFFKAMQTLQTIENERIKTHIKMTPRTLSGTLQASDGGLITTNDEAKIDFAAAAFVDAAGNNYVGEVNVFACYLDPTIDDLAQVMPGNLTAIDATNRPQLLTSYGMMNVELEDPAGNPLQISAPATLTMPAASLSDNTPAEIPLWYFDEENGTWREEGSATLQGDFYVGEVSHFTWWNCDVPSNFVFLEGQFDGGAAGTPVLRVKITRLSDGTYGITETYDKGLFAGAVPKDELLLLEVLSICGEVIYTEEIGSFGEDSDLGIIAVDVSNINTIAFTVEVVDCINSPVTNGYVSLTNGSFSEIIPTDVNGQVTTTLSDCGAPDLSWFAVDLNASQGSEVFTLPTETVVNAGIVQACGIEFITGMTFTLDGQTVIIPTATVTDLTISDGQITAPTVLTATDVQNTGQVNYSFSIWYPVDNNGDGIIDGGWVGTRDLEGETSAIYDINIPGLFEIVSSGEITGSVLHVIAEDVEITELISNTQYESVTVEIRAVIQ